MDEQARRQFRPDEYGKQRQLCRLEWESDVTAIVRDVSGRGAFVETVQRPPLGSTVRLRHLQAGAIECAVTAHAPAGITVAFPAGTGATGFALAVVAAGLMRP